MPGPPRFHINTGNDRYLWGYARIAYDTYGQSVEWHTHNGGKMPPWEGLGDRQKRAWYDTARAIYTITHNGGLKDGIL